MVERKITVNPTEEQQNCVHHWLIDTAAGPTSMGQCQHCGLTREYKNVVESWEFGKWNQGWLNRRSYADGYRTW